MPVTMKQIAADLGLSIVTVSKALRNHDDISLKTRARIQERVDQLGYRPNLTARSLVTGRSSLVGLLVPDLIHPFFAEVARSLAKVLRAQGIYLLICASESDPDLEREQLEHLSSRGLDAIVVAHVGVDCAALENVANSGIPLILLDREAPLKKAHFVGVNDVQVGLLATEHLLAAGCKRIAHLRGPDNIVGDKRLEGYKRALRNAGVAIKEELIFRPSSGEFESTEHGNRATTELLARTEPPDGLFCFSDPMAMGAMHAALAGKVAVPEQLKIIGCGNLHYDYLLRVSLSSVDQKSAKIGERAAGIILEQLQRQRKTEQGKSALPATFSRIILRPQLVVRDSTRA
jgi:LacI family transcriptional regulator